MEKRAIVIGASSGIGREVAKLLKVSEEIQIMPFIAPEAQGLSDRCCGAYATLDITIKNDTTCFLS